MSCRGLHYTDFVILVLTILMKNSLELFVFKRDCEMAILIMKGELLRIIKKLMVMK